MFGASRHHLLRQQAQANPAARNKSLICIVLNGGPSHIDMWDLKPAVPIEYRGPLGTVKTRIDGVYFSESLQRTAQIADRICVVRSMTHGEAAHERGTHNMFTGYRPSPALKYPSIGSIVSHEFGSKNNLPPYVCIPNLPTVDAGSGYLSSAYGPFSLGADPAGDGAATQGTRFRNRPATRGLPLPSTGDRR